MNPYTSLWTGVTARRRAAGVPPRPARQRPHRRPRRRGRAPGAALHPLLRLPQRLPGLRADRRPRLRVGLPGADRRDPDAAARPGCEKAATLPFASSLCGACYEVCPVKIDIPTVLVHLRGAGRARARAGAAPSACDAGAGAGLRARARGYELAQRLGPRRLAPARAATGGSSAPARRRSAPGRATATCRSRRAQTLPRVVAGARVSGAETPAPRSSRGSARPWAGGEPARAARDYRRAGDARRPSSSTCFASASRLPARRVAALGRATRSPRRCGERRAPRRLGRVPAACPAPGCPTGVGGSSTDEGLAPRELDGVDGALTGCALGDRRDRHDRARRRRPARAAAR